MKNIDYDLSKIVELSDNDQDFIKSMVAIFLEEMPKDLEHLTEAVIAGDKTKTYEYTHKMKPSVDMFGLSCLKDVLVIEAWGQSTTSTDINEHFVRLHAQLERSLLQLKRDF
jgi:HPt (histidine-containing phosphotransfer) domain-containing protein